MVDTVPRKKTTPTQQQQTAQLNPSMPQMMEWNVAGHSSQMFQNMQPQQQQLVAQQPMYVRHNNSLQVPVNANGQMVFSSQFQPQVQQGCSSDSSGSIPTALDWADEVEECLSQHSSQADEGEIQDDAIPAPPPKPSHIHPGYSTTIPPPGMTIHKKEQLADAKPRKRAPKREHVQVQGQQPPPPGV